MTTQFENSLCTSVSYTSFSRSTTVFFRLKSGVLRVLRKTVLFSGKLSGQNQVLLWMHGGDARTTQGVISIGRTLNKYKASTRGYSQRDLNNDVLFSNLSLVACYLLVLCLI